MPPSSIAAPEVVSRACWSRFRSEQSVPNVVPVIDNATLAMTGQRVPSARPIDHRWDRSRGIIFSNIRRKLDKDKTWIPSNGIVFAQPSTPSRTFASRRIGNSVSADVYGLSQDFTVSHDQVQKLRQQIEVLERKVDESKASLAKFTTKSEHQLRKIEGLQSEELRLREKIDLDTSSSAKIIHRLREERDAARVEIDRLAQTLVHSEATIESISRDNEQYERDLSKLREESAPDRYKNKEILSIVSNRAKAESEAELLPRIEQLSSDLKFETIARQETEATATKYERDIHELGEDLYQQKTSLDSQRKRNADLQSDLAGRRERKLIGRSKYRAYRNLFRDFQITVAEVHRRVELSHNSVLYEQKLWHAATRTFERSAIRWRLLQKYPDLVRKISGFLLQRASDINSAANDLYDQLGILKSSFSDHTHTSRMLTRFHHFEEFSLSAASQFKEALVAKRPFTRYLRYLDLKSTTLTAESKVVPSVRRQKFNLLMQEHKIDLLMTKRLASLASMTLEVQNLRERLQDNLAEKKLFVVTDPVTMRMSEAQKIYSIASRDGNVPKDLVAIYRDAVVLLWDAIDEFKSITRREYHLKDDMKQHDEGDRDDEQHFDSSIATLLANTERARQSFLTRALTLPRMQMPSLVDVSEINKSDTSEEVSGQELARKESRPSRSRARRAARNATARLSFSPTEARKACGSHGQSGFADALGENLEGFSYNESISTNLDDCTNGSAVKGRKKRIFQMSPKGLENRATTARVTDGAHWSFKLYRNPEGNIPRVFYYKTFDKAEEGAKLFVDEEIVGFDLEWEVPGKAQSGSIKSSVSLIQIACEDKIGLFHVARFHGEKIAELLPPSLRKVLESSNIVKAGVNITGDASRLRKWLDVDMVGIIELSHLYRIVAFSKESPEKVNFKLVSLADQVQDVLMLPLKKDSVRVSKWSRDLDNAQTEYAATDAYAGFQLYHQLEDMRESMNPMPPRPSYVELNQPLILGDGTKVYRAQKKVAASKKNAIEEVEEDDSADEEFFDAVESVDVVNLNDGNVPISEIAETSYPHLPLQDCTQKTTLEPQLLSDVLAVTKPDHAPLPKIQYPVSQEMLLANSWIEDWQTSRAPGYKARIPRRMLQVYHLWHHQNLGLEPIGDHCRRPPLAANTVAQCILTALTNESLPYNGGRLLEVLQVMPASMQWRYRNMIDRVDGQTPQT